MNAHNKNANKITLTMIGCGKMGGAMMRGWLGADIIADSFIYTRSAIDADISEHHDVSAYTDTATLKSNLAESDVLILAVKPQGMAQLLDGIKNDLPKDLTIISVAAGLGHAFFAPHIGSSHPFIRVMPNTPCAIGCGMSGIYATANVTPAAKAATETLMQAVGETLWINDEAQMDGITAVSGSGPAYVFHFIEALAKAAEDIGFDKDSAMRLARQTVTGAAALADSQTSLSAEELRINVTSPGGTTEAGLNILMHSDVNLENLLHGTVDAALKRGIALGEKTNAT
jgi:pyrroline-5-carboxylate reductase